MAHLHVRDSLLLVVDMQTRLLPAILDGERLVQRARLLAKAARLLGIPVVATEHCSGKIGPTMPSLLELAQDVVQKTHFDATHEPGFATRLPEGRTRVLLMGTEAHVCVLQTALGLAGMGLQPVLVADCIGSRRSSDQQAALGRAAHHGLEVVTSEMAMFEWLETAQHPRFAQVLALIKSC